MKAKISNFLFLIALLFLPAITQAADSFTYTPMEKIPGFDTTSSTNFYDYINNIYKFGIWAIGICALLMIMIGGYMYITSAGNNASMEKAKGVITDAVIGLILALSAYLLLYTINPDLVKMKQLSATSQTCSNGSSGTGKTTESGTKTNSEATNKTSSTGKCSDINSSLANELKNADNGVPTGLLAAFMKRECSSAMSNSNACSSNNSYGAGGSMQFIDSTWSQYKCSGSKFNRQDALSCAAKKISNDSGGDYSENGIRKAAKAYCGSCTDKNACGGDYCDGIVSNYDAYKNCSI